MIRKNSRFGNIGRNRVDFAKLGIILSIILVLCVTIIFTAYHIVSKYFLSENSISKLYEAWNENDIESVYKISSSISPRDKFLENFVLPDKQKLQETGHPT